VRFVHRHTDDPEQHGQALSASRVSPELVALGVDGRSRERFSTREMIEVEQRLERSAGLITDRSGHEVSPAALRGALAAGEGRALNLGGEQRDALDHITHPGDLAMVVGYAGTGKSAMLGVAREACGGAEGYSVQGAALSGIAAESLEAGSGIGSRQMERVLAHAERAGGQDCSRGRRRAAAGDRGRRSVQGADRVARRRRNHPDPPPA